MARCAILLVMLMGAPCAAQTDTVRQTPSSPMRICWRGKPIPECRSFWITEVSGEYSFASTRAHYYQVYENNVNVSRYEPDVSWRGVLTMGPMFNRNATRAIGGTVSAGVVYAGSRFAIEARGRRWYPNGTTIDLSTGVMSMNMPFTGEKAYGLTAGAFVGGGDLIHLTAHGDLLLTDGRMRGGGTVGGGFGTYAAVTATVLLVSLGLLSLINLARGGDF